MNTCKISSLAQCVNRDSTLNDAAYKQQHLDKTIKNLHILAYHQNWFSRNLGGTFPKSLRIVACKIAQAFNLDLTELNLAKIVYLLCRSYMEKSDKKAEEHFFTTEMLIEILTTSQNNNKGDLFLPPQYGTRIKNITSPQIYEACLTVNRIFATYAKGEQTSHFADEIKETYQGYKSSGWKFFQYTDYTTYNSKINSGIPLCGKEHFKFFSTKTHVADIPIVNIMKL